MFIIQCPLDYDEPIPLFQKVYNSISMSLQVASFINLEDSNVNKESH